MLHQRFGTLLAMLHQRIGTLPAIPTSGSEHYSLCQPVDQNITCHATLAVWNIYRLYAQPAVCNITRHAPPTDWNITRHAPPADWDIIRHAPPANWNITRHAKPEDLNIIRYKSCRNYILCLHVPQTMGNSGGFSTFQRGFPGLLN